MKEHSFDTLAKEMANSAISRSQMLKYFGAATLGSMLGGAMFNVPAAEAKKKKKKKKHKRPPISLPRTCTAGDALGCTSCGTSPATGNSCSCVPSNLGNPTCIDTKKGAFSSCTSDNDCPTGAICIEEFACGKPPGTFSCAFPCGT